MRKNVASQHVAGQMNSRTDGSPLTASVSVTVSKDGGAQAAGAGTLTHMGGGAWDYAPTQAETNANHIAFQFTHATGVNQTVNVYTVSFDPHDTAGLGLSRLDVAVSTRLAPTVAGRTLDVTATGEAGLDFDNTAGTIAKGTDITGFNDLDAAGIRSAVGLASANLDTQLAAIAGFIDTEVAAILAAVDTEVAAIKAKTDNLPAAPAATGDQMALTAAAIDAILDDPVEGTNTVRQLLRGFAAALLAKVSGMDTNSPVFRDLADSKDRITATTDANGNRTAVTLDLT